jgi:hypothetical protein
MLRDVRAIRPLCDAAPEDDYAVVPILEQFGDAGVAELLARLRSRDPSLRRGAAYALQFLGAKSNRERCFEPLIAALKDDDPGVRIYAADALHHSRVRQEEFQKALWAAFTAEQDLNTRLKMRAILNDYDPDHKSEALWS